MIFFKKKGQLTIEFVSVVSLGLIFILVFSSICLYKINKSSKVESYESLISISNIIKKEIELAKTSVDGYERSFELPNLAGNTNYSINVYNNTWVSLETPEQNYVFEVSFFYGNVGKRNVISKNNDFITINKVN